MLTINQGSISLTIAVADTGTRHTTTLACRIERDDPYGMPDVVRIGRGEYPAEECAHEFERIADVRQIGDIVEIVEYAINDGGQDTGAALSTI